MRTSQRTWFAAVLALVALAAARPLHAESVDGARAPASETTTKSDAAPKAFSAARGVSVEANLKTTTLAALDIAPLLAEDEAKEKGNPLRTGVSRDLKLRAPEGGWTKAPDGWIWAVEVRSTDAKAIRLHFTLMDAAAGVEVLSYSPDRPDDLSPVYGGRGPLGDGDFWTPFVAGDRIRAECFVPGESATPPAKVPFTIDAALHMYRSPFEAVGKGSGDAIEEGGCHNDVMCFPAWGLERDATARIDFVVGGSGFLCTGQLINTLITDLTPYFLTANHCISSNAVANTAVISWNWQTSSCGGSVPAFGSLPTSSVCTLLSNGATSDYSLLMVEGTLPGGRGWVGWNSGGVGFNTSVTCVHHPDGAFKRISFGATQLIPFCGGTAFDHIGVGWGSGVTEPGSSGSGLYNSSTHQLIGQLHCGASSCSNLGGQDSYGAFSSTYGPISGFLNAGSDDGFENNDACASAWGLSNGGYGGMIVKSGDEDWFSLAAGPNAQVSVSISFTHAFGDIDMGLYTACGTLVASSTSTGNSETINYTNTTGASPLFLRVYLFSDTRNQYSLSVNVTAAPNLNATVTPSGFSWPIVPRTSNDAGFFNAVLPATLNGDVGNTWLNWAIQHEGPGTIGPGWDTQIKLDWGAVIASGGVGPGSGPTSYQALNVGAYTIPGGRHSLTNSVDTPNAVLESNESDNVWTGQYVWSPTPLVDQASALRAPAPHPGFYATPNCDGYAGSGAYWGAFGIIPQGVNDYDLQLFNDYSGSLTGFQSSLVGSFWGGSASDFVIWNNNWLGFGSSRQAGVTRFAGGTGNYAVHHSNEVTSVFGVPTTYGSSYVTPNITIGGQEVLKLHEVYLDATSAPTFAFTVENLSGTARLNCSLYDQAGTYFAKSNYLAAGFSSGPGGNATMNYLPTTSGWYVVAVWKSDSDDIGLANTYQLRIGPALSNLSETIAPETGWDDVVVPRNDGTGGTTVSPTLDGNATNTYASWLIGQLGPNNMPAWSTQVNLDEELWSGVYSAWDGNPPGTYFAIAAGPYFVRGGRHTVTAWADAPSAIAESNESDNRHDRQLIWSPLNLLAATPQSRPAPPHIGYAGLYNADGIHHAHNTSLAWIVSAAPQSPGDDYDLWLATDYVGSTSGYSVFPTWSLWGGNSTEYVIGHFQGTPADVYPEVTRAWFNAGGGGYSLDANNSNARFGGIGSVWDAQSLPAGRLADVYELYMTSGSTAFITLRRLTGTGAMNFEVFSGATGTMSGRGGGQFGMPNTPDVSTVSYTASVTGYHPIAVFRDNGTDSSTPVTYKLVTSTVDPVGVGDPEGPTDLSFAGALPNPVRGSTRFSFSLREAGDVQLALFDLGGRRVRTVVSGARGAGHHDEAWDGRDDNGRPVGAGLYWARLHAGGKWFTKRVTVLQ